MRLKVIDGGLQAGLGGLEWELICAMICDYLRTAGGDNLR